MGPLPTQGVTQICSQTWLHFKPMRKKSILSFIECATTRQGARCPLQPALHPGKEGRLLKDLIWEANWKSRMISLRSTFTFLSAVLPVIWMHLLAQKGSPFQCSRQLDKPKWKLETGTWGCSLAPHGPAQFNIPCRPWQESSPLLSLGLLPPGLGDKAPSSSSSFKIGRVLKPKKMRVACIPHPHVRELHESLHVPPWGLCKVSEDSGYWTTISFSAFWLLWPPHTLLQLSSASPQKGVEEVKIDSPSRLQMSWQKGKVNK